MTFSLSNLFILIGLLCSVICSVRCSQRCSPSTRTLALPLSTLHPSYSGPLYLNLTFLGTAHISTTSSFLVTSLTSSINFDHILLELCPERIGPMLLQSKGVELPKGRRGMMEALQSKYAKDLNVTLGCDFLSVINSSQTSPIHLIDRRVSTTMSRISSSMSKFQRIKFGADLMFSLVKSAFESKEKMRKYLDDIMESDNDMLTEEMLKLKKRHPNIYSVVVKERDVWLSESILECCYKESRIMYRDRCIRVERRDEERGWREYVGECVRGCVGGGGMEGEVEEIEEMFNWKVENEDEGECLGNILVVIGKGHLEACVEAVRKGERVDLRKLAARKYGEEGDVEEICKVFS
ncbi:hypothetical protein TrST_g10590 [Triparma strigata]|uniref:Uncharacterized protein n=1 Tax=Triparma strigata TaxID=1606541 RepID=A0A9W6ZUG0_9STRA|nr:hypothetical protein TrST_g10590 [Triparma strigata]